MKKILLAISILAFISCNNTEKKPTENPQKTDTTPNIEKVDSNQILKKRAMELMHLSLDALVKTIDGSMTQEEATKLSENYEKEFKSIIPKLSKEDSLEIQKAFEKRTDEIFKMTPNQ